MSTAAFPSSNSASQTQLARAGEWIYAADHGRRGDLRSRQLEGADREPEPAHTASRLRGLAVRSRTSSFALRDAPRNAAELGNRLGADYLVEGSVLRSGNDLRVNLQLARVRDDLTLWSGRFDGQAGQVFEIQDEISRAVVDTLRLKLGTGPGSRRRETDTAVYDLYLRARSLAVRGGIRGTLESIGPLEQVIP